MAKVTIKGIPEARDNALKFLQNTVKDKKFLDEIGQLTADQIRNRTRARKGVLTKDSPDFGSPGVDDYRQPKLKDSTIERRKSLIRSGNAFDPQIVTAKKSNLSLSGQLLDAIKYRVNQGINVISIYIDSKRNPYRGAKGQNLENKKSNNQIKDELEERGRRFFFISDKLNTLLTSKIAQQLRRKLSLYNKIVRKLS